MRSRLSIFPALLLVVLAASLLSACGSTSSSGSGGASNLTFKDATGTTVTLTKQPTRIVCLVGLCEDILATLGIQPVAVNDTLGQDAQYFGAAAKSFAQIGGGFATPNVEDIVKAQPDLVIGIANAHEGLRDALKPVAPLYIMNPISYNDSIAYLEDIGRLTGHHVQADAAATTFREHLSQVVSKSPKSASTVLIYGSDVNFNIMTAGSLPGGLLTQVTPYAFAAPGAGSPQASDQEPGAIPSSVEKLLAQDPDTLLIASFAFAPGTKPLSQQLAVDPAWSNLKAVKNNRVYEVSPSYYIFGRGTISLGLALDDAMTHLYPSVFPAA